MSRSRIITAIDVGSSKTATIIGQLSDGQDKVNIVGVSSLPSQGIKKGQIVDINLAADSIIKSVEAAERMAGCSVSKVSVTIGGAHVSSQNSHGVVAVSQPEDEIIEEDVSRVIEAAKAVSLPSSREILHVIPRKYTVDSQEDIVDPVGMSGVRLEVETHIVTGSSTAMKNMARCIEELGADVDDWVFSGLASATAVLSETETDLGVILIDIGGGTTSIVVFVDASPLYSTVIPIGAINVTKDLATGLRLSTIQGAEKVKIALSKQSRKSRPKIEADKEGSDELDLSEIGVNEEEVRKVSKKTLVEGIIRPRLNEIFGMVAMDLQNNGFVGLTPAGVVLTGGGSLTVGAVDVCKRTLSLPVRIGYPERISGLVDEILDPSFSAPAGLLLRKIKGERDTYLSRSSSQKQSSISSKVPIKGVVGKISVLLKKFLP